VIYEYTEAEFEVLDAGVYPARLKEITEGTGEYGPYLRWAWAALDEQGNETETEISGLCNPILNSRSKVSQWVAAHLGRKLEIGERVDLRTCIGKDVLLTLTIEPRKDGNGTRNKVAAVSPAQRAPRPPTRPQPTRTPAREDTAEVAAPF
jgi:hypothetical protein